MDVGERGEGVGLEGGNEGMLGRVEKVDGLGTEGIRFVEVEAVGDERVGCQMLGMC